MEKYPIIKVNDPYFKTPHDLIVEKIKLLDLKEGELVYDLGCGDARALIEACRVKGVSAIGYEILPEAFKDAKTNILEKKLEDRVQILSEDFYDVDISSADAIILYLTRNVLGQISLKLEKELKAGARIVTHTFDIPAWNAKLEKEVVLENGSIEKVYLYVKE